MASFKSLILLTCALCISASLAKPVARSDDPPRLDDTLAVAKSPFEPVTMAFNSPGARNDESLRASGEAMTEKLPERAQSTRSTQGNEQERDSTSVSAMNDSETSASTQAVTDTTEPSTTDTAEPDSTTSAVDTESTTTIKPSPEPERQPETSSAAPTSTTTQSPPTTTTQTSTSTDEPESIDKLATSEAPKETVTTEAPKESSSSSVTEPSTESNLETVATESQPKLEQTATTSSTTTTQASADQDQSTTMTTTTSTTPSPSEAPIETSSSDPTTTTTTSTTTTTTTTTTQTPEISTEAPVTSEPEKTSAPSTTAAPLPDKSEDAKKVEDEKKVTGEDDNKNLPCNHLPTYQTDEIQKVFREETTYKNGTIKGKFTYINFDQRYRLVHYTRLPYGPVKIDLVEELGRPEQAGNQSSPPSTNEASYNSVLQLRNLLPNSLFDFPFSPRPQSNINKSVSVKEDEDNKSNMYFYSTENISTPNLLTPSVPVSILPGQRRLSQPVNNPPPASDVIGSSYFANLPVQQQTESSPSVISKQPVTTSKQSTPELSNFGPIFSNPNQHQFQYAISSSQAGSPIVDANRQQGLLYGYLSQAQAQPQYQYSPAPIYSFQQPSYYYGRALAATQPAANNLSNKLKQDQSFSESTSYVNHQTHQPHSHEHYVAPFMFNQPPTAVNNDQNESSRLKMVKVKASKALNSPELYTKSAQLRSTSSGGHSSSSLSSPAHLHRQHRHRSGKQNQDLKSNFNNSPVVYHVLRSPAGRVYSLPQYQGYAMAYDHDD